MLFLGNNLKLEPSSNGKLIVMIDDVKWLSFAVESETAMLLVVCLNFKDSILIIML